MDPTEHQTNMHQLPVEILEEIFARLSTKYLVRLRCVSKQWNKIVGDPKVIHKQLNNQIMRGGVTADELKVLYLRKHNGPFSTARISEHAIYMRVPCGHELHCCYNGLYCFSMQRRNPTVVLFNPLTGEALELPSVPQLPVGLSISTFGLGFDAKNHKHKVIRVESTGNLRSAQVLILGEECWKQIELPYPLNRPLSYHNAPSMFLNGTLFRVLQIIPKRDLILTAFDIEKETFSSFDGPFKEGFALFMEIGGCLAIPEFQDLPSNVTNIWVLKDNNYSKPEWSVQCRIQHDYGLASAPSLGAVRHILQAGVWKSDQVIFRSGDFVTIDIQSGDKLMAHHPCDCDDGTQRIFKKPLSLFPLSEWARSVQYHLIQEH